jgi:hypothetical protein
LLGKLAHAPWGSKSKRKCESECERAASIIEIICVSVCMISWLHMREKRYLELVFWHDFPPPRGACKRFPSNGTKLDDVTAMSQWLESHEYKTRPGIGTSLTITTQDTPRRLTTPCPCQAMMAGWSYEVGWSTNASWTSSCSRLILPTVCKKIYVGYVEGNWHAFRQRTFSQYLPKAELVGQLYHIICQLC